MLDEMFIIASDNLREVEQELAELKKGFGPLVINRANLLETCAVLLDIKINAIMRAHELVRRDITPFEEIEQINAAARTIEKIENVLETGVQHKGENHNG